MKCQQIVSSRTMEMQTAAPTARNPRCFVMTLSSCRRVQIVVFIFIFNVYLAFVAKLFIHTFIVTQGLDTINNIEGKYVSSINKAQNIKYCKGNICINKCCPVGTGFVRINNGTCVLDDLNNTFNQVTFFKRALQMLNHNISETDESRKKFAFSDMCGSKMNEFGMNVVHLLDNGNIDIEGNIHSLFCLDFVVGSEAVLAQGCKQDRYEHVDYNDDFEEYKNEPLSAEFGTFVAYTYIVICLISKLSILATLIVYASIPQLRNIHGKILICYLVSIMIYQIALVTAIVNNIIHSSKYFLIDFTCYLALIIWMSWLTVMCYDIWAAFSHSLDAHPRLRNDNRKFMLYLIGVTANVIFHAVLLGLIALKNDDYHIMPLFVKFVVTFNVVMYLATLNNLRFHRAKSPISNRHGDSSNEGILMYTKLMFLMGLDWLLIIASINFGGIFGVFIGIFLLELQGVTLLLLLVCNRRVLRLLCKRSNRRESV